MNIIEAVQHAFHIYDGLPPAPKEPNVEAHAHAEGGNDAADFEMEGFDATHGGTHAEEVDADLRAPPLEDGNLPHSTT